MPPASPRIRLFPRKLLALLPFALAPLPALAQQPPLVLSRGNATVMLEPYAPNILRVTLSLRKADALAAPDYGILAHPAPAGWRASTSSTGDTLQSDRLTATVSPAGKPYTPTGTQADIAKFFNGSTPGVGLDIKTADGKPLLHMNGWQMSVPNHKDGNAQILNDRRPHDHDFLEVGATFRTPPDEHFYGLGQNQEGYLDRRGHVVRCAHDYNAPSGQSVCVPFVVTKRSYGLLWDNPSRTTVAFGFNDQTSWLSDVGQRVSFFVIAGNNYDEIYTGYRLLTGDTPIPPKSASATSSASSATAPRPSSWPSPTATAIATSPSMTWSSTGSTTQRWARWTWTLRSGPTPPA